MCSYWNENGNIWLLLIGKNFSVPAPSPGLESCPHKELSAQTALSEPPLLPFEFPASFPLLPSDGLLQFLPPA